MSLRRAKYCALSLLASLFLGGAGGAQATSIDMPIVKLRSLDKITARTATFEAAVGEVVKFGSLYIKVQSCKKSSPIESPEAASFLQIWENDTDEEPEWIFSGWMFASSPALSAMDHAIYDVWVLDCIGEKRAEEAAPADELQAVEQQEAEERGEGVVDDTAVVAPDEAVIEIEVLSE